MFATETQRLRHHAQLDEVTSMYYLPKNHNLETEIDLIHDLSRKSPILGKKNHNSASTVYQRRMKRNIIQNLLNTAAT